MTDAAGRLPIWRLSSFYFVYYLVLGTMMPYWSLYLDACGLSSTGIAWVFAVMSLTRILGPNLWGWLADKSGQRLRVIRLAAFAAALTFCAIPLSQDAVWIAVVIGLHTLFWNGILAQYEVITLNSLGGDTHLYGRVRLWGSVSFICAVWGLGWLFDLIDVLYLPWLLILILLAVALATLTIRDPGDGEHHTHSDGLAEILRRPGVLAFMAGCFLLQVSHGAYYTFFSLYAEALGYNRAATGFLWAVGVIAEIAVFAWMYQLRSRFGVRQLLLLSVALTVVRWLLTAFLGEQLWVLLLAQTLHAFSYGSFHGAGIEYVQRQFGRRHQGQGQALYSAVSFGAGTAAGALISGYVWDYSAMLAFVLSAVAAALCWLILALWVGEDAPSEAAPSGSGA